MTREEAIQIIRETYHTDEEMKALESLIPELRESEDERIRKALIQFLNDIKSISESGRTSWAVRKEDAEMCKGFLTYLEKQEQKPSWSEEDERIIEDAISALEEVGGYPRTLMGLKSLHHQPSWKPSEEQMLALNDAKNYLIAYCQPNIAKVLSELEEQLERL